MTPALALAPPITSVPDIAAALAEGAVPDVSGLRAVHVNPLRRIAWVQPGATCGELDAATQEHGLAVTGARDPSARVVDFALAGGHGWLDRRLGLAADNVRAVRVMTADGIVFAASERENADLFWALRGGGQAGFAVVVELELALRPLGPEVLAGTLQWPRERARELARAYRDLMADAPDALCGGLELRDGTASVVFLYAGAPGRGAEHLAALRALGPAHDDVRLRPYRELQARPPAGGAETGHLDALPDAAIDAVLAAGADVLLQPLGGAHARTPDMGTAAGHRAAAWAYAAATTVLHPWSRPEGGERRARLAAVKERWDPDAVFGAL